MKTGLVLEGGAMKGVYTAGVLDFFLDAGIDFAKCYGVSAGACCLCSYLSRQKGRQYSVFTDYLEDKNYWGLSSLLRTGDYFNVQMCYHDIPERLNPFDYETFDKNPSKGYAVVTNIETGLAEYLPMKNMHRNIDAVRASASMPLVSRPVEINGKLYLDGGLADSIPLLHAVTDGCRKNVVVMTKETGYRRVQPKHLELIKARYAKYPSARCEAHLAFLNDTAQHVSSTPLRSVSKSTSSFSFRLKMIPSAPRSSRFSMAVLLASASLSTTTSA